MMQIDEVILGDWTHATNYGCLLRLWYKTPCKKHNRVWKLALDKFHFDQKKRTKNIPYVWNTKTQESQP